ncbi:MAG: hypothetical protein ACU0A0_09100 [Limimaricola sp.]
MNSLFAPALAALLAMLPASAMADPVSYGAAYIHSWHVGTDSLNDNTPGLAFGRRWVPEAGRVEYHLEGGVFWNSYEEVSPILLGGVSWLLAEAGPGALRLGGSVGTARYEAQSRRLEEAYGIPNLAGFVPIVALTATWRMGATDIRLSTLPPDTGVDAIFNLSVARSF